MLCLCAVVPLLVRVAYVVLVALVVVAVALPSFCGARSLICIRIESNFIITFFGLPKCDKSLSMKLRSLLEKLISGEVRKTKPIK